MNKDEDIATNILVPNITTNSSEECLRDVAGEQAVENAIISNPEKLKTIDKNTSVSTSPNTQKENENKMEGTSERNTTKEVHTLKNRMEDDYDSDIKCDISDTSVKKRVPDVQDQVAVPSAEKDTKETLTDLPDSNSVEQMEEGSGDGKHDANDGGESHSKTSNEGIVNEDVTVETEITGENNNDDDDDDDNRKSGLSNKVPESDVKEDRKIYEIEKRGSKAGNKYRDENEGYDTDSSASISDDSSVVISSDSEPEDISTVNKKDDSVTQKKKKNKGKNRDAFELDIRTKGELTLEDLPPIEELKIDVDDSVSLVELGTINSLIGPVVIVQAQKGVPAVDQGTVIFTEDRRPLGQVFETFGPVPQPLYVVRFNSAEDLVKRDLFLGEKIFYAPNMADYTHYVFVEQLKAMRGSDASWEHNNEPPKKYLDYSDDEVERKAKGKGRHAHNSAEDEEDDGNNESKKRKKNRQRHKQNSVDMGQSHQGRSSNQSSCNQWPPNSPGQEWSGSPRWPSQGPAFRHMGPPNSGNPRMHSWNMPPRPQMGPGAGAMLRGPGRTCWEPSPVFDQNPPWGQPHPQHNLPGSWGPNNPAQNMPMDYRFIQHRESESDFNNFHQHLGPNQHQPRRRGPCPSQYSRMPMPSQFGGAPCFPRGPPGWSS